MAGIGIAITLVIALVNDWSPVIHQGKNLGNVGFPMITLVNPLVNDRNDMKTNENRLNDSPW